MTESTDRRKSTLSLAAKVEGCLLGAAVGPKRNALRRRRARAASPVVPFQEGLGLDERAKLHLEELAQGQAAAASFGLTRYIGKDPGGAPEDNR